MKGQKRSLNKRAKRKYVQKDEMVTRHAWFIFIAKELLRPPWCGAHSKLLVRTANRQLSLLKNLGSSISKLHSWRRRPFSSQKKFNPFQFFARFFTPLCYRHLPIFQRSTFGLICFDCYEWLLAEGMFDFQSYSREDVSRVGQLRKREPRVEINWNLCTL